MSFPTCPPYSRRLLSSFSSSRGIPTLGKEMNWVSFDPDPVSLRDCWALGFVLAQDSLQEEARQVANKSPGNQQGAVGESNVQINCSDSDQGGLIELEKLLKQKTFTRPEIDHLTALMLSRTLMHAFSSTPVFGPFVIPLFLEKLSSSLHSAKIDPLQYLRACSVKYGSERIAKYAKAVWSSLKDTINTYLDEPDLSFSLAPIDGIDFPKNEVVIEALSLLQELIVQNSSQLISLIIDDEDVNFIINNISSYENYNTISVQEKKKLHAIGRILYLTAKTSIPSCNAVFQSLLSRMMDNLGFSASNTDGLQNGGSFASQSVNFGFLYLCIELLAGCRELVTLFEEKHGTYFTILHSFSAFLFNAFGSVLAVSDDRCPPDRDIYIGVKGLLILAMFHLDVFPIPKSTFENILKKFMAIIVEDFDKTVLWNATLKSIISYCLLKLLFNFWSAILASYFHGFMNMGGAEKFVVQFAVEIWSQAGNCMDFNSPFEDKGLQVQETRLARRAVLSIYYNPEHRYMIREINKYCYLLIGLSSTAFIFNILQHFFWDIVGENLTKRVREKMLAVVLKNEIAWFDQE
ncbi:hypothetical protein KIW84_042492 [Lathyrus oleraceus]|uniref:MMS19 nucleotide excision repair protein n=1 Tax=Pisum sativum TaxID=3888 RepID=A0A9D4XB28_PEA|nr:hypothetical protein KIW84_042492 [Pisum sativum]